MKKSRYDKKSLLKALDLIEKGSVNLRKAACQDSFGLFFIYYYSRYVKYPFADFHFEMMEDVEQLIKGEFKELIWMMFRESAKTSIAKAFVVWCIVYQKKRYINYDSYDKGNAESALFDIITELTTNKQLIRDFGQLYERQSSASPQMKRISNFITNNGVKVEAFSTQESARGRIYLAFRPDLVIMDDFENTKTKDSDIVTQKVIEHIDEFKKALDSADGKVLYLCNYITDKGSVHHLKKRSLRSKQIKLRDVPVVTNCEIERNENGLKIVSGETTWKGKYSFGPKKGMINLNSMIKEDGSTVFYPEMLNQPIDDSAREFKSEWFKYEDMENVLKKDTRRFLTIDTRGKDSTKKGDSTGITMNFVDLEGNWFFRSWKGKWNTRELVDLVFTLYSKYFFEVIGIEQTTFTEGIQPYLEDEQMKRNTMLPIEMLKHGGVNKHTRIRGLVPWYERGKVYHIMEEGENTCKDLEHELARFPKTNIDDTMDSAAYQIHIAEAPMGVEEEEFGMYEQSYT